MLDGKQEQERLKRLRDKQLTARDPNVKERQFQKMSAERERKRDRSYTLSDLWYDMPIVVRYVLVGFLLGGMVYIALPKLWDSPWAKLVSIGILVLVTAYSAVLGNGVATREDLKDMMRRR